MTSVVAATLKSTSPNVLPDWENEIVWFFFAIAKVTDCEPLFQLPLPGCDADNVQSPADTTETVAPETVHTPVVDDEYERVPPPVALVEAEVVKFASPNVLPLWLNETV